MDINKLGLGVMINMLTGNQETVDAIKASIGKTIAYVGLENEVLRFIFNDGVRLGIWDDGQSCCESRYMRTDDNLTDFFGGEFLGAEVNTAPSTPCEYGDHEVQFLDIRTSKGVFQMASHNEHNGYYGGFSIKAAIG